MTAVEAAQNSSVIPRARAMSVHSQRGVLHFLGAARNLKANDTRAMVGHGHCVRSAIFRRPVCMTPRRPRGMVRECRSEEHTSELQSRENLVCRLLLEKKKGDRWGRHHRAGDP